MSRLLPIILLCAFAAAAQPATRAEVAAQREAIEAQFTRDKAECEKRFSVAACLDELRQRRHDALTPLVQREHELSAEERRSRAAAQVQRVRERELAAAQDEGQRRERVVLAPAPASALPATPASHAPRGRSADEAAQSRLLAERKAEAEAAKRRLQAREREARLQQQVAAHEAKEKRRTKPPAAPLPLSGAASTATAASAASAASRPR